jgi:regulator-associated protein of mTOR
MRYVPQNQRVSLEWKRGTREHVRTVCVGIICCLNLGVTSPDYHFKSTHSRVQAGVDPNSLSAQKALETIGENLQAQYTRWHPKAMYRRAMDPTMKQVMSTCTALRHAARSHGRVLLHYNGHGVPHPTANRELWVYNKSFTEYIPLAIQDLFGWLGAPLIMVLDCSRAGLLVNGIDAFLHSLEDAKQQQQHRSKQKQQHANRKNNSSRRGSSRRKFDKTHIMLGACGATERIFTSPDFPADFFTACLTTPLKVSLKWLASTSNVTHVPPLAVLDALPWTPNKRKTLYGELNRIFTALTDVRTPRPPVFLC